MKQTAIVKSLDGVTAIVRVRRESACDGCHSRQFCVGCAKTIEAQAQNDVGANVGDTVVIETSSPDILFYSLLAFIVPIALGMLGYALTVTPLGVTWSALIAIALFFASFLILLRLTNHLASRRVSIHITEITEMASLAAKLNKAGSAFPESGANK